MEQRNLEEQLVLPELEHYTISRNNYSQSKMDRTIIQVSTENGWKLLSFNSSVDFQKREIRMNGPKIVEPDLKSLYTMEEV